MPSIQYFDTANRVAKKEIPFYENYEFFLRTLAEKTEKIPTGFIVKTGLTLAELFLEHSNSMKKEHPFFLLVFKENINSILQNEILMYSGSSLQIFLDLILNLLPIH